MDTSNSNLTPPATSLDWYELKSVDLDNMTIEQESDRMGVPVSFEYMAADNELEVTEEEKDEALAAIRKRGKWRADMRSPDWVGKPIADALG